MLVLRELSGNTDADVVSTINLSKLLEVMEQRMLLLEQTITSNVLDVEVSDSDNNGGFSQDVDPVVITNIPADNETDSTWAVVA